MKEKSSCRVKPSPFPILRSQPENRSVPWKPIAHLQRTRLLYLLAALTLLTSPAAGQNVSVTDYSVPVSRADNLRIDVLSLNYVTEGDEAVVQSGNLGIVYKKFYDSLPFAYSVDLIGATSFNKNPVDKELVGNVTINLVTRIKKYTPAEGNLFIFGDTDFDFDENFDRLGVDMTLGIGLGRFINATALRKAVRIEDFFLEEGIISRRLPKETMIELGHIIEREREFKDLYGDRYRNYWFEDMTNEIKKSNLVLGEVGFGILRMQEVLFQERINDRFYGWEATAGIQFNVLTPLKDRKRRDPSMSVGFRYSRPLNWSTQVNARFNVNTPFSGDFGRIYNLSQTTDFIYELTNKISFTAAQRFRVTKQRNIDAKLSTTISFALTFFIENKINLTASEQLTTVEGQPFRQSFNVGLTYKLF